MKPIYLDYNATTPVDPAVREAMLPFLDEHFGNASSKHAFGAQAHQAVEKARAEVAALIGAEADEILFTCNGTEASNHVIKSVGLAGANGLLGRLFGARARTHLITSTIEHPATLEPCAYLRRLGCRLSMVPVDRHAWIDPEDVRRILRKGASLVSIMHSNNEVGTLEPIREIATLCRASGALLHTDAAQSLGKVPVHVKDLGVDFMTIAGHKLYAPKGIGALYLRRGLKLEPLLHGGGQESGRRAGTENVPYIVALGEACRLARLSLPEASERLRQLRDRLWQRLQAALGERVVLNGHPEQRLPNTLNVNFVGHIGAELLAKTPAIAASTGSACHAGQVTQSSVLCAMGVPPALGGGAVRLTVGRFSTEAEIDQGAEALIRSAQH